MKFGSKRPREEKEIKNVIRKQSKFKLKSRSIIIVSALICLCILAGIIALMQNKKANNSISADSELLRAMNYEQFVDGDDAVYEEGTQGTDNEQIVDSIKFSSFFLRDIDGDGYAEKLKGTCKEVGKEDTLYMEIIVQTEGYLKNAKIEIDGKNFYLQTSLPKDSEIKGNYIGNNIQEIEFEKLNNGTQKMLTGIVRSGDYTYQSQRTKAIGNNINNYSREDNKVILSGTYVDEEENEIDIRKEIPITMDWYGTTIASIERTNQTNYDVLDRIDEENNIIKLNFTVNPVETKQDLNLSYNYVEGIIPELNGYAPISVRSTNSIGEFSYDDEMKKFTIQKFAIVGENGVISSSVASGLSYALEVIYPMDSYREIDSGEVQISIPVKTYFYGYNNPNNEFTNPCVSNTATENIIANFYKPKTYSDELGIKIGKYVYYGSQGHSIISKRKPLRLYNGTSEEEKEDYYTVSWYVKTGTNGEYDKLVLKENKDGENTKIDTFIKSDSTEESMEDVTSNVGIYFSNVGSMLKEDGEIKIYDIDTDNLLVTFTKDGKNGAKKWGTCTESNPYYYDVAVKHIRIETTSTNALTYMYINNIKELDDDRIVEKYEREEFDNLKYIKSNITVYKNENILGTSTNQAVYEEPYSIANILISKNILSTQTTEENYKISIDATANESNNQVGWKNGSYLVKIPDEIITLDINSVEVDNNNINISSYELVEKDGHKFLKIKTSNNTPEKYKITMSVDITPDPRMSTETKSFELYATNMETDEYFYKVQDIYDVDNDGNIEEFINSRSVSINLVSPNSLLTNQTMSDFDDSGTIIISPQIADLKPIYSEDDRDSQTVKIGVQMKNNYSSTISEAIILGKIPYEGNCYVVSNISLNSEYTTEMIDTGIEVPEELQNKVTIYYSENENPGKDLYNSENGWTLKENVSDFSKIKTYLIDLEDTIIGQGAEYTFYYTVEIPFGVEFNKIAYSHHGIYFSLDTPEGKYKTCTEPNKIGVRIADKYNLELTKYQTGREKKVEGATYKVSKLSDLEEIETNCTAITNNEGKLEMANLYAEKVYEITEIETPENYELSEDVIGIIGHINRTNGVLTIEKLYGETKNEITVQKNEGEDYKAKVNVEDEARACLKIIKTDERTNIPIKGVKYKIFGTGFGTNGRIITTNVNGEAILKGIRIGEEYILQETKAEGYYLASQIIFKIVNNNGIYELDVIEGETKANTIILENDFPILNLEVENEMIPRYNLEITKIKHVTEVEAGNVGTGNEETTYLQGAKFKLYKDRKELGTYITDENGKFTIENLYQYQEEKGIDQTYVLKEVLAPDGYTRVKDITFKISNILGVLNYEETLEEGQGGKDYTIEGNTVKLTVEDNPTFKLIKKDGETKELLPNTKFSIYNVDDIVIPARNSKGELIGEKEVINGQEYYIVTTDSNGEITVDLSEGLYKAVEVEAPDEKYEIDGKEYYFGIGASREPTIVFRGENKINKGGQLNDVKSTPDGGYVIVGNSANGIEKYDSDGILEWNNKHNVTLTTVELTPDGGYIAGGYYTANSVAIGEYTVFGTMDFDGRYYSEDGIIIKYSSDGNVEWVDNVVGRGDDRILSITSTDDEKYIMVGVCDKGGPQYVDYAGVKKVYGSDGTIESTYYFESNQYNANDRLNDVVATSDGGFAVVGIFSSNVTLEGNVVNNQGNADGIIIKYNSNDELQWAMSLGEELADSLSSIVQTEDDGFIIAGSTSIGIIKINSARETEWRIATKTQIKSILKLDNGDFLALGTKYIIKFDKNGNVISSDSSLLDDINALAEIENKKYVALTNKGELFEDFIEKDVPKIDIDAIVLKGESNYATSVTGTKDNGYVFGGKYDASIDIGEYHLSSNPNGAFVSKVSQSGRYEWVNGISYDTTNTSGSTSHININNICQTEDECITVVGDFYGRDIKFNDDNIINNSGSYDGFIVKYNNDGSVKWAKKIGNNGNDSIGDLVATSDGGIIAIGYYSGSEISLGAYKLTNNSNSTNGLIIKYSKDGNVEWAKSIGGQGIEKLKSICQTIDGNFVIAGEYTSKTLTVDNYTFKNISDNKNGMLFKISNTGELIWAMDLPGNVPVDVTSVSELSDGGFVAVGYFSSSNSGGNITIGRNTYNTHGYSDGFLVRFDANNNVMYSETMGTGRADSFHDVDGTSDGGYIVMGYFAAMDSYVYLGDRYLTMKSNHRFDGLAVKYDIKGEIEWLKQIGGESDDNFNSFREINKETYVAIGNFYSSSMTIDDYEINKIGSGTNGFLIKFIGKMGAIEENVIEVENKIKEFKITTDIKEIDDEKGGTISGEDMESFEKVKYDGSNTKEIKIIPDENYEIINITINGEEYPFDADSDGSYTMPQFTNVLEDKHVVVTFSLKDNKITINKTDSKNGNALEGAIFKLDQLEEREEPINGNIFGELTDNGQPYYYTNMNSEVTGVLGELTSNGTYYFVQQNNGNGNISYVPINSKTWQLANVDGATEGVQNSTAHSYIPIDLTGLDGHYKIIVNAEIDSQANNDYGFAKVSESTTAPSYNNTTGRFIYISGAQEAKDYESTVVLEGGKTYYLHLGYYKNANTDTGNDQIVINWVKIYKADEVTYNFVENNGKYESTNQGKVGTVCNSYIPLDLSTYQGKYNLTINAELQNLNYYDSAYGYITITESTNRPLYSNSTGRSVYITSNQSAKDYETILEGGKTYYIHMGYYLASTRITNGLDKFTINSISLTLNDSDLYHTTAETNSEGQAITQLPFGKYAITETKAPNGYILDEIPTVVEFREGSEHEFTIENDKNCNVIVHHYIKDTSTKVAEDDLVQGKEGETYNTSPKIDLLNYEPEKGANEEYIMPDNYTGEFTYEDQEVIYYYVPKGTLLTVNHYIEGTETKVPLKNGTLAETEYTIGDKGTSYETNYLTQEELSDYYTYSNVVGESSGIYGDDEIIVTYYYKKTKSGLTINKYDEDGATPLEGAIFSVVDMDDNIVELGEMTNNGLYYFKKQDDKYISNNQAKGNTVANSYVKIDMTYAKKEAKVVVNAEISSQRSYDYGYVTLSESNIAPYYNTSSGRFVYVSGTVSARDFTANLEKGKVYYLHFGYRKNANIDTGEDTFTINSIRIEGAKLSKTFTTNELGKIEEDIDAGHYEIREIKAPYGYITPNAVIQTVSISGQNGSTLNVTNERKTGRVIVHHYIEGTEIPVAEDEIIEKKVFENYSTNASESVLDKYEVLPDPINKTGTIKEEDTIVTYYYRRSTGNLKINKVDADTNNPIEGVSFGIYEGDYGKVSLDNAIKVGNIYNKIIADKTDKSDINPQLYVPSDSTGFVEVGGKYVPVNCTWYVENQDDTYEGNYYSNAYVNIDLSDKAETEFYLLTANVEMRNTENNDMVWVWFNDGYMDGNWVYLRGEYNQYFEIGLKGGRNYQLCMEYCKSSSIDIEDYVAIEMELYNTENGRIETINEVPYDIKGIATTEEIQIDKRHYTDTNNGLPFAEEDGVYVATTCQKYMNDNNIDSADNWTTWSEEYVEVNLTNKEGYYVVSLDLLMQNTTTSDHLYLWIENASDEDDWENFESEDGIRVGELSGENSGRYHVFVEGGKKYFLYFNYGKNSSTDVEDYVEISNIKVFKADAEKTYRGFDKTADGKYVSNIQGINDATAHSVIPIDLRDKEETTELTVNAEISSEQFNDYGKVIITDTYNLNDYPNYRYNLINISGEVNSEDYTLELESGRLYYLHMLYEKNWNDYGDVGEDKFTINEVRVETPIFDTVTTNENGIAEINLPTNEYTLVEHAPKEGYEAIEPQKINITKDGQEITVENEKVKGKVTVYHFIEGTEENISNYDGEEIEPEIMKGAYGDDYDTEPVDNLDEKYELIESPSEPSGIYSEEPQTKTYYYRIRQYPYVVNYLLKDDDDDDTNNTVVEPQKADTTTFDYGTIINAEDEVIDIDEYEFDSVNVNNLKITAHNNEITIYYTPKNTQSQNITYKVEYYKEGERQDTDTQNESVDVGTTGATAADVDKTKINILDKYVGHKLEKITLNDEEVLDTEAMNNNSGNTSGGGTSTDPLDEEKIYKLPDQVSDNDVIKVYYTRESYLYFVKYFYDDVQDESAMEVNAARYGELVSEYVDKVKPGYRLKEEVIPIQITEISTNNVMNVYYVTDNGQTKEISYKVEYYKNNSQVISDAYNKTETVQNDVDTIDVVKDDINIVDKYDGYELDKIMLNDTVINELPDTASNNDVIKVYYKAKDSQIIVKYVDEEGNTIKVDYIVNGKVDETVDLSTVDDGVDGYEIKTKSADGVVSFESMPKTITYTYTKKKITENAEARIIVKYLDITTKEEVAEQEIIEGKAGDVYKTEEKILLEYSFLKLEGHKEGLMQPGETTIIYWYTRIRVDQGGTQNTSNNRQVKITDTSKEKKTVVKRIVSPDTGDPVPVIAYSTIIIVLIANVIVFKKNREYLKKQGLNNKSLEFAIMKRQAKREKIVGKRVAGKRTKHGIESNWKEKNRH